MMKLSELTIYPVKSMAGISLSSAQLDRFGLHNDRRWMVVNETGRFLSQRTVPCMALISAQVGGSLRLTMAEQGVDDSGIDVPLPVAENDESKVTVEVWGDQPDALDCGPEVAMWLSERLGQACRLVYMPETTQRLAYADFASSDPGKLIKTVSFADGYPLMLIGEGSLNDLNSKLDAPVPMNRFRPNVVIEGAEAFAEDSWKRIRIGELEFELVKPCERCSMPPVDQTTGEKDGDVLKVLAGYRRRGAKVYFGQNLLYGALGELRVGDEVVVLG